MAQIDEKNDKVRGTFSHGFWIFTSNWFSMNSCLSLQRLAEEKAKKKAAVKRQEELEQKRKLEEEARKKKIQQVVRWYSICFCNTTNCQVSKIILSNYSKDFYGGIFFFNVKVSQSQTHCFPAANTNNIYTANVVMDQKLINSSKLVADRWNILLRCKVCLIHVWLIRSPGTDLRTHEPWILFHWISVNTSVVAFRRNSPFWTQNRPSEEFFSGGGSLILMRVIAI